MFRKNAAKLEENAGDGRHPQPLGVYFMEARLAKGLDLPSLARDTSIILKHLIALEEDNRDGLPADVFTRGFVKIYAVHLGLDPQEAIRLYERQWGANHRQPDIDHFFEPERNVASLLWVVVVLAVLAGAIFLGLRLYQDRQAAGSAKSVIHPPFSQAKGRHKPAPEVVNPEQQPPPAGEPVPGAASQP